MVVGSKDGGTPSFVAAFGEGRGEGSNGGPAAALSTENRVLSTEAAGPDAPPLPRGTWKRGRGEGSNGGPAAALSTEHRVLSTEAEGPASNSRRLGG